MSGRSKHIIDGLTKAIDDFVRLLGGKDIRWRQKNVIS